MRLVAKAGRGLVWSVRGRGDRCRWAVAVFGLLALLPLAVAAQDVPESPPPSALDVYLDAQSAASVDLVSKQKHPPVYPDDAYAQKIQGTVLLIVTVDALGAPVNVTVERSSRNRSLDRAAITAASAWRYVPARVNGQAVIGKVRVPVDFSIDETLLDANPGNDRNDRNNRTDGKD